MVQYSGEACSRVRGLVTFRCLMGPGALINIRFMRLSPRKFAPGSALRVALRQLLRQVLRAIGKFPQDPAGQAHFVRTRVKRLQSLSRLVPRGQVWQEKFLEPCRALKDLFAETRDITIVQGFAGKYALGEAHHLRASLPPDLVEARRLAEGALDLLADDPYWVKVEWKEIAHRAVDTYRAARVAWKEAKRRNAPDEVFHAWRRRVKRLLYQCEYLGGRAGLRRFIRRVDRLGEVLGDMQDMCLAEMWLKKQKSLGVPPDLSRSKESMRRAALRLAPVLLGSRPKVFRQMLG